MPEDRYLATYARSWLQSVTSVGKHTKNRTFKLFGMNNSGLNTFLPRFLSPQKPPKGFNSRRACIHLTSIVPYMDDAQVKLECTDISMIRHGEGICIYSMLHLHVQSMTSFSIDWNAIVSSTSTQITMSVPSNISFMYQGLSRSLLSVVLLITLAPLTLSLSASFSFSLSLSLSLSISPSKRHLLGNWIFGAQLNRWEGTNKWHENRSELKRNTEIEGMKG